MRNTRKDLWICCNHFTSLAYEIFYARKVYLFDKIKEDVFPNFFHVCFHGLGIGPYMAKT
jgi:hypothetical protein